MSENAEGARPAAPVTRRKGSAPLASASHRRAPATGGAVGAPAAGAPTTTVEVVDAPVPQPSLAAVPPVRAPVTFSPTASTAPTAAMRTREDTERYAKQKQAFEEAVSGINFDDGYSIQVHRQDPMMWRGHRVGGLVTEYKQRVDLEEIRQTYGGGKFKMIIFGPGPTVGSRVIKGSYSDVMIAGNPIPQVDDDPTKPTTTTAPREDGIVKVVVEQQQQNLRVVQEELKETRGLLMQKLGDSGQGMTTFMQMLQAERQENERRREAEERLRRELEEKREQRWREERAEAERIRREEQAAADRRHQESLALIRADAERRAQEAKASAELRAKELEAAAAERQRQHERDMQARADLEKQRMEMERANQQILIASIKESTAQQMQVFQQVDTMKTQFFTTMLNQRQDTGIEGLLKAKRAIDELSGNNDGEDRSTFDRVMDRLEGIAPSLMGGLGLGAAGVASALGRRNAGGGAAPAKKRKVLPGSRIVIDDTPAPAPAPKKPTTEPAKEVVVDAQAVPVEPAKGDDDNTITAILFPKQGAGIEETFECLVRSVDFYLASGKSPEEVVADVVDKFPPEVRGYLSTITADDVVAIIEEKVPNITWHIRSPKGVQQLREIHRIIVTPKGA